MCWVQLCLALARLPVHWSIVLPRNEVLSNWTLLHTPSSDQSINDERTTRTCARPFCLQEQKASDAGGQDGPPTDDERLNHRDDRPIGGKRPTHHPGPGVDGSDSAVGVGAGVDGDDTGTTVEVAPQSSPAVGDANGGSGQAEDGGVPVAGTGLKPWQRRKKPAPSSRTAAAAAAKAVGGPGEDGAREAGGADRPLKPWQKKNNAAAAATAAAAPPPGESGDGDTAPSEAAVATSPLPPAKPWQKKSRSVAAAPKADSEGPAAAAGGEGGDEVEGGVASVTPAAAPAKPWLKKRKPVGVGAGGASSGSGDCGEVVVAAAKPWQVARARATGGTAVEDALPGGEAATPREQDGAAGGEGDVAELEACLGDRDWKKRVAAFEVLYLHFVAAKLPWPVQRVSRCRISRPRTLLFFRVWYRRSILPTHRCRAAGLEGICCRVVLYIFIFSYFRGALRTAASV